MKSLRSWKMGTIISLSTVMALSATACSNQPAAQGSKGAPVAEGPVKLNMAYYIGWNTPSIAREDNPSLKYLEDKLGIRMNLTAAAPDIYKEKLKVMIASGDVPDAFAWTDIDDFMVKLIKSGVVIPLDKHIDEYPNLKKKNICF